MLRSGDGVIVAVSGGPDSMALLNFLSSLKNIKIFVAHINHMLRGADSFKDEVFVQKEARRLKKQCFVSRINVKRLAEKEKISIEEAGRDARYRFLEKIAKKINAKKIALAHNNDDNIETFIMRLVRGTGIKGLRCIPAVRGKIIRPFIDVSKEEILDYCSRKNISFRIDKTNLKEDFQRNKIRHSIIPVLHNYDPSVRDKITSFIGSMNERYKIISSDILKYSKKFTRKEGAISVLKQELLKVPTSLRGDVVRKMIEELKGSLKNIYSENIESVLKLKIGSIHLPGGLFAYSDGKSLKISREMPGASISKSFKYELNVPGIVHIKETGVVMSAKAVKKMPSFSAIKKNEAYIDASKIKGALIVRNFRPGDSFVPLGMKGRKKLQDLFVDEKIPLLERRKIPIVADKEKIIWVAGYRMSEEVKVAGTANRILSLKIKDGK